MLNYKLFIMTILILSSFSCNKLKIKNFFHDSDPTLNSLLTHNYNYQRNSLSEEEIIPPLELIFYDDYYGLPSKGFSLADSILFFGTGRGYLVALNANNYDVLGKKKFGLSASSPPTIYKNFLYQTYDGGDYGIVAYDIIDGAVIWEIENKFTSSSPIIFENKVYYQTNNGEILCFNYLNGEKIWRTNLGTKGINSIAFDNGKIISTNQNGKIFSLEYTSGVIIWEKQINDNIFSDPVINRDQIYISTYKGYLYQISFENGSILKSKNFGTPIYHAITVDKNNIFIPLSNGEIHSIGKDTFAENWILKGSGPAASSAVVSDHYVYYATLGKHLYIIDKKSGENIQEIQLQGRVRTVPIIKNGKLIIACENDNVNIFAKSN